MTHETWDAQAAAYALGALDGGELAEFERHLAEGCGQCEFALVQSAEALALMSAELPTAPAPPGVREVLVRRLAADQGHRAGAHERPLRAVPSPAVRPEPTRGPEASGARVRPAAARPDPALELRRTWWRWSAAAAAALIVGAFLGWGFVTMHYEARLGQMARQAIAQRDQLRAEIAALQGRAAAHQEVVELLRDPTARVVAMRGAGPSPDARGRVVWHERTGGRLLVDNLPPAPQGKAYEAWTISGGKPRPAGVFQVDASGDAVHSLPPAAGPVDVFAITLEPAAGVPAPTGPIVLASAR
jgi:anti-sigma-K factor RskA